MQNASDQKTEMEKIKGKMAQEVSKIGERKAKIDDELKEVQVSSVSDYQSDYLTVYPLLHLSCIPPSSYRCPSAAGGRSEARGGKHQARGPV